MDNKDIFSAMVKARKEFGAVLKNKQNPHLKNKYADLASAIDAVSDALANNGLMISQISHDSADCACIETLFLHESGTQFSAGRMSIPVLKKDAQGFGSALTYARRYSLLMACGIAPEDDDGNAAAAARPAEKRQQAQATKDQPELHDAIKADLASGNAKKAAEYLAGIPPDQLNIIWEKFTPEEQTKLSNAWPK